MARSRAKKIIQVPIEDDLLERIDETAGMVAESRAAFIREACRQRLKSLKARELERRYTEGYRKKPEDTEWGEMGLKLLAARLAREKW
ncbi:MAG: ribbon-helix-helix protein, CopG family [Candidatus Rokubacteria bacterium]|nr:ribbon-helix-helix protein, CopG family [Candidatus Rokubacteria bacterium]